MNYAGILAGGKGTRAGSTARPKQFLRLADGTPILVQTLRIFLECPEIDRVVIAAPEAWLEYTRTLVEENCTPDGRSRTQVIVGGAGRSESLANVCRHIDESFGIGDDDILISHDAVRPFVTQRIIRDNIAGARKFGCVDTVVPAIDTLVISADGESIDTIPPRDQYYQGQTPQTFYIREYLDAYDSLTADEKATLTDACKVYLYKDKPVHLVQGDYANMKITTAHDLEVVSQIG